MAVHTQNSISSCSRGMGLAGVLVVGLLAASCSGSDKAAAPTVAPTVVADTAAPTLPPVTEPPATAPPDTINYGKCADLNEYTLDGDSPISLMKSLLSDAAAVGGPLESSANAFAASIDALAPPAEYALEAVGRTRFVDDTEPFIALMGDIVSTCGLDVAKQEEVINLVQKLSPQPSGLIASNLYGRCDSSSALIGPEILIVPPNDQLITCGQGPELLKVSLDTGVVTHLVDELPSNWHLTPDRLGVYWSTTWTYPAEGLNEPAWKTTVDYRPLDGSAGWTADVVPKTPGLPRQGNSTAGNRPLLLHASADRIVYLDAVPLGGENPEATQDRLVIKDNVGTELAGWLTADLLGEAYIDDAPEYSKIVPGPAIAFNYPGLAVIDIATGTVLVNAVGTKQENFMVDSPCASHQLVGFQSYDDNTWHVVAPLPDASGNIVMQDISQQWATAGGSRFTPFTSSGLLVHGDDDSFSLVGFDGVTKWTLPPTVVYDAEVVGDWVVVTNLSNEQIIVDPTTGQEATLDAAAQKLILGSAGGPEHGAVLPGVPTFDVVGVDGGAEAHQVDLATLCRS